MAGPQPGTQAFVDAVQKQLDKIKDPVRLAVKAIIDGEKEVQQAREDAMRQAIKDYEEGEKKIEKAREDALKKEQDELKRRQEMNSKYGEGLSTSLKSITSIATSAQSALISFGGQLSQFVGKANPVAVMKFQQAVDDLQAVIGRALLPVLERVTGAIRQIADAFVSLSPQAQQLVAALSGGAGLTAMFAAARFAVVALLRALGPIPIIIGFLASSLGGLIATTSSGAKFAAAFEQILQGIGTVFEALAGVILPLVETALEFITPLLSELAKGLKWVGETISEVLAEIGLSEASTYKASSKSSVGAAVRQASSTSLSAFATKSYTSALSGSSTSVADKQLSVQEQILAELRKKGLMPDGSRREDREIAGSSALGRAAHPFEIGTDGKSNFKRGTERIKGWQDDAGSWVVDRLGSLLG